MLAAASYCSVGEPASMTTPYAPPTKLLSSICAVSTGPAWLGESDIAVSPAPTSKLLPETPMLPKPSKLSALSMTGLPARVIALPDTVTLLPPTKSTTPDILLSAPATWA